jgi:hypothetical protein
MAFQTSTISSCACATADTVLHASRLVTSSRANGLITGSSLGGSPGQVGPHSPSLTSRVAETRSGLRSQLRSPRRRNAAPRPDLVRLERSWGREPSSSRAKAQACHQDGAALCQPGHSPCPRNSVPDTRNERGRLVPEGRAPAPCRGQTPCARVASSSPPSERGPHPAL